MRSSVDDLVVNFGKRIRARGPQPSAAWYWCGGGIVAQQAVI